MCVAIDHQRLSHQAAGTPWPSKEANMVAASQVVAHRLHSPLVQLVHQPAESHARQQLRSTQQGAQ
jgi:hypothetical protein